MPAPLRFVPPMECQEVDRIPEGDLWQYELKLDGYRLLASKVGGEGLDSEAVWNPRGAGRPIVELDRHFPEAPHLPIPASAEQP